MYTPGKYTFSIVKVSFFFEKEIAHWRIFFQRGYKYIWFSLFFSPGAPRRLQTTYGPENPVSLLENRPFEKCMSSYLLF